MTCRKCQHQTVKKFGYTRTKIQRYRCTTCSTTFSDCQPRVPFATMRVHEDKALQAIQCLLEGCSIRSTERLTGLHRDTILQLLVFAGERCGRLLTETMRGVHCRFVQVDEI